MDLSGAQHDPSGAQGLTELTAGPGPVFTGQGAQRLGDPVPPPGVRGRAGAPREQGGGAPVEEVLQHAADGVAAVAEMGGDPGRRPAGVGEGDHLQAVSSPGR